ncbi:hypothetical protein G3T36_02745 [Diaminobutyricibacter tongyongensis]|uniref:Uncharacterized protein n=1 Tax=Leifsonia tongyongensis TaxID=1268043 RepID=A0A6L9XTP8_9MICO|nr:hypothetical protein [Diaminobutyricibacter tongyongensis]NEN04779.1 hypothetical protein [Diaminobutyricibacter tongyongensis]
MTEPSTADSDPQAFLGDLVASVARTLPAEVLDRVLTVDRPRTLADRIARRPGLIREVRLTGTNEALRLSYDPGPHWKAEWARVYRGATISTHAMTLGEWLTAFAGQVAALAADAAGDSASASRALQTLGIEPAGSEIRVSESTLEGDLLTLPARLGSRVPSEAVAAVGRIAELLVDTLARVAGQGEPELIVRRTAMVYLPDTLRAYLSLPADWAVEHVFPDGTTPARALVAQLGALESAAKRMRDAAVDHDASALLVNGRFLADRFATSRLDLS